MDKRKQWEQAGFVYGGLFGLNYKETISVINKLLKPHGLKLEVKNSYREMGDASMVRITPLPRAGEPKTEDGK